ncbi:MAG: Tim44/TimA family putative adaptor protein [Hyphomicrobiaceae bacterium]|nr:Tim44/TimA family putative adaptor protein [Hyphomicrobiaceae bacterium]
MDGTFDITTLLFLILAVVIFLRLRNVLGRRTGNERQPYDPYTTQDAGTGPGKPGGQDTVVPLPNAGEDGSAQPVKSIAERVKKFAPKGSPLEKGLTDIAKADAEFDPEHFLSGAKAAYEMIVMAFAGGNRRTLRQLLGKDVYDGFVGALDERESRGEQVESSFVGINKADIIEAELKRKSAQVTVKFVSELITATRDKGGKVIDGDPKKVREVTDIWTFARDISSRDPNWKLVATEAAN